MKFPRKQTALDLLRSLTGGVPVVKEPNPVSDSGVRNTKYMILDTKWGKIKVRVGAIKENQLTQEVLDRFKITALPNRMHNHMVCVDSFDSIQRAFPVY